MPEFHRDAGLAVGVSITDCFETQEADGVGVSGLAQHGKCSACGLAIAALVELAGRAEADQQDAFAGQLAGVGQEQRLAGIAADVAVADHVAEQAAAGLVERLRRI